MRIVYNSSHVTYDGLLDVFWRQVNPTDDGTEYEYRGLSINTLDQDDVEPNI